MANKLIDEAITALVNQEELRPIPLSMGVYIGETYPPSVYFTTDGYFFEVLPFKLQEYTVHEYIWRLQVATEELASLAGGGLWEREARDYTRRNAHVFIIREGFYQDCIIIATRRRQGSPWSHHRSFIRVNRTLLEVIHGGKKLPERDELQENTL